MAQISRRELLAGAAAVGGAIVAAPALSLVDGGAPAKKLGFEILGSVDGRVFEQFAADVRTFGSGAMSVDLGPVQALTYRYIQLRAVVE